MNDRTRPRDTLETSPWDSPELLATLEDIAAYIEAAFEDGDPSVVTHALGVVARAKGVNIFEVGSRNPGATNVRLQTNAASARSPHPSNVPTGIVRNALRAMTAAREHPLHAGSAIVRRAQSTRSAPIAAFGVIALPAHARARTPAAATPSPSPCSAPPTRAPS